MRDILSADGLPYEEWHLAGGDVPLSDTPPAGVFYNRMSASSHTRGHRFAPELAGSVLAWLEAHGRRVVNGGRALELEVRLTRLTDPGPLPECDKAGFLDAAALGHQRR